MWKKKVITTVCTETPTLNAGTSTRGRMITYNLDLSRWIHGVIHVEEKGNYHSVHGDAHTQCRHIHKE